jgi:hypothetical protein
LASVGRFVQSIRRALSNVYIVATTHAAYRTVIDQIENDGQDVFMAADLVRQLREHPGWRLLEDTIAAHERRNVDRLVNETTKPEQIPYLRGLIVGLRALNEAADTIVTRAEEVRVENQKRLAAQELAHV